MTSAIVQMFYSTQKRLRNYRPCSKNLFYGTLKNPPTVHKEYEWSDFTSMWLALLEGLKGFLCEWDHTIHKARIQCWQLDCLYPVSGIVRVLWSLQCTPTQKIHRLPPHLGQGHCVYDLMTHMNGINTWLAVQFLYYVHSIYTSISTVKELLELHDGHIWVFCT